MLLTTTNLSLGDDMNTLWNDDEPELEKRITELETRMEEMWERMKQYELVMSTAFRMRDAGDWRIKE